MEQVLQEFHERIVRAAGVRQPLQIRGSGSKDWYGCAAQGELLSTAAYRGIVDYEPTELVITARCGTPLAEIEATLAQQRQMLAFEPPHFGPGATVGGMLAAGLSGPRRAAVGAVRDFVLGAVLMDGRGEVLHFGGQVMKNVAGYDVSRLLAGSLGTLGLVLQVSLKVLPQPAVRATHCFEMSQADALQQLNQWGGQPLPISASAWREGLLTVRFEGAAAAVASAQQKLGGAVLPEIQADALWNGLREQTDPFFAGDGELWRLSVPSTTPVLAVPGTVLIEWGGAQRWLAAAPNDAAAAIRAAAADAGGHASLWRTGDKRAGVFAPLAPAVAAIHRRLKAGFDPAGIFNPGRMYPDL
ncbi:MAG TPA: glycolate oxidase subunit GlcE [Burkholderiaceae bacterium]|nr:glycolate oxidase subunit GlcE [Burkholderiaceae bacterium]